MGNELDIKRSSETVKSTAFHAKKQLQMLLPADQRPATDIWIAKAVTAVSANENVAKAAAESPDTFVQALAACAELGLSLSSNHAYIIPRWNSKKKRNEINFMVSYLGYVELMMRTGIIAKVVARVIHANDALEYDGVGIPTLKPGANNPDYQGDPGMAWAFGKSVRGEAVAAYAYVEYKDGTCSDVVVASRDRIMRARNSSDSWKRDQEKGTKYSPWTNDPEAMMRKTAIRDLVKFVSLSTEDRREEERKSNVSAVSQQSLAVANSQAKELVEKYDPEIGDVSEAIETEEVPDASGELASDAQMKEIQRRTAKAGYEGKDQIEADLRIQVKDDSASLDSLTREQADIFLAWLPR